MMPSLRTLAAIVGGYLVFALSAVALFHLTGRDPHAPQPLWFELFATVYGMCFAALGGFIAARAARDRPLRAVSGVAILLALGALVSLIANPGAGATWSQWAALILMAPSVYLGLALHRYGGKFRHSNRSIAAG
ncbi:MAG TPA: hypothetical protein VIC33_00670 [Vicinamibacterales bacterium]|jgi:peptidoglycan/LPS O-acetylase OafA/YrhL